MGEKVAPETHHNAHLFQEQFDEIFTASDVPYFPVGKESLKYILQFI